jgi:hypothetical protein
MTEKPSPINLTPQALRRAVLSQSAQHPTVVYPAAIGVLGGIAAAAVLSSPLVVGTAIFAGGVAVSALLVNVFARHDDIAGQYLRDLRERLARERKAQIEDLAGDLESVGATAGTHQLDRFLDKLATFQSVLSEKLSPNELTFERFSAIAEAVFLAGVENLRSVHLAHKTLNSINETYLRRRIQEVERSSGEGLELTGLRGQLAQAELLCKRVADRLGENELALAELDKATAAVSDMKSGSVATMDMESAMTELARIAQRSSQYV